MRKPHALVLALPFCVLVARCASNSVTGGGGTPTPTPTPTPACRAGAFASAVSRSAVLPFVDGVANRNTDINRALGAPDNSVVSLGSKDCFLVVDLGANGISDCPGSADIQVTETGGVSYKVSVADDPNGPVFTVLGEASGTASFDLTGSSIACTRFVRIDQAGTDTPQNIQAGSPGSDIDAVRAIATCR